MEKDVTRPPAHRIVGYFTGWGVRRGYEVKNIITSGSADKLTVINYAFGNVEPVDGANPESGIVCKVGDPWEAYQRPYESGDSTVEGEPVLGPRPLLGNFQQLRVLKERYPNIKVLISLGGWTGSKWFSDASLTEESRRRLVASCIDLFIQGNLPQPEPGGPGGPGAAAGVFDGIDVDWEYPATPGYEGNIYRPEDTRNFTLLLQEFRRQLDGVDKGLLLTIAAPAGPSNYAEFELGEIHKYLDFINLMTYDMHGVGDATTNFQSNLYTTEADPSTPRNSTDATVQAYLKAGIPPEKIVVGVPFYGHGWTGVPPENHGLYQPVTGLAQGTRGAGGESYHALTRLAAGGATARYWSDEAKAAWLYDGTDFWTFDDPQTMGCKAAYVRRHGLGGMMFWELSGDTADGELISAIAGGLNRPGKEDGCCDTAR